MSDKFNPEQAVPAIKNFITESLEKSGLSGYVVGLSGGIDSALSACLAVQAIGSDGVFAVLMPYRTSSESSLADATKLVEQLGIQHRKVDISPMIDAYFPMIDDSLRIRAGNKMARERMAILFDIAHEMNRLVLGTGNRSEICLGYTTIFGDAACSINPIGELYKTEVRQLAMVLGVPDSIIAKPPTADLWADQTDEGEIGITYKEIDGILRCLVDEQIRSAGKVEMRGFDRKQVDRLVSLLNRNAFKRSLPPVAPLGRRQIPEKIQLTP